MRLQVILWIYFYIVKTYSSLEKKSLFAPSSFKSWCELEREPAKRHLHWYIFARQEIRFLLRLQFKMWQSAWTYFTKVSSFDVLISFAKINGLCFIYAWRVFCRPATGKIEWRYLSRRELSRAEPYFQLALP